MGAIRQRREQIAQRAQRSIPEGGGQAEEGEDAEADGSSPMKTLSPAMLKALRVMHEDPEKKAYVNTFTLQALEDRGLAHIVKPTFRSSASGRFPNWMARLTEAGIAFCDEKFRRQGRVSTLQLN
jgi:hypothetical protein